MNGILSQIKALNSEPSVTSTQEQPHEPHHCFNDTCAFPFGDACPECRAAAREKEERRVKLIEARRAWKWIKDDQLGEPTGRAVTPMSEEGREERRQRWSEHGTSSSSAGTLRSVESLRSLMSVVSNVSTLRTNQSVRSLREILIAVPPSRSHRLTPRIENRNFQNDQQRNPCSPDSSQNTIALEREPTEEVPEVIDTLRTQHWLSTLPSLADMTDSFNPQSQSCRTSLQSINSSILDAPAQQAQSVLRATAKLIEIPAKPPRAPPRTTTPSKSRNSNLCPFCSRLIGDPTFQHLLRCQFAHDEKAQLDETMRRLTL